MRAVPNLSCLSWSVECIALFFRYNAAMSSPYNQNRFLIPAMVVIALLAAATGYFVSVKQAQQQQAEQNRIPGLFWPNPRQLSAFSAVDHTNQSFGLAQLQDKWTLVFFGYTNCPDICPITLSVLARSYPALHADTDKLQVVFVGVDPERDTIDQLSQYVAYFNEDFIGVGGNEQQINSFTRQLGAAYFVNKEEGDDNYLIDHSASLYLIDPRARMVGKLSPPHEPELIQQQFTRIREFIDAQG